MIGRPLRRFRTVNGAQAAALPTLTSEIDLTARDAGTAAGRVIQSAGDVRGCGPRAIRLFPFGVGADNDAFLLRVVGWRLIVPPNTSDHRGLWVPQVLLAATVTLSAFTGPTGSGFAVASTDRFADTISVTAQPTRSVTTTVYDGAAFVFSPTGDLPAWLHVPTFGCELIELQTANSVNTPTTNALFNWEYDDDE